MFYKYTLNKDKTITEEHLTEYDGDVNIVVGNIFVSETERFDTEIEDIFKLFGSEED